MSIPRSTAALLDAQRLQELIDARFPQIRAGGRNFIVEEVAARRVCVRMVADPVNTRPGGTISGPAMFTLADFSVYVAIIATLGEAGFEAVTSSLNINFLAKPEANDMTAVVQLIRLGRRLAVGEVELYSDGGSEMVAHAVATYALPVLRVK
jgi:uncharacterized protein (TIGR00369 family)